ncbi:thiol reductant ABC exporter subunit CydC [Gracilibacillus oryzae]|uniref:Thiol reductant ABC exporter subunit CydC n=1 Tax=Gracilibacillus oryzae TaxID=1672701 RepID=A0A7C8KVL6_9BACI|nr:thiol reductant ABC exporter subunit CydC [Gracilibacillus oryzae]KAB8125919.1 thiol reductant ABC exporter subunit CydC [Gracilibacillus oryzae]
MRSLQKIIKLMLLEKKDILLAIICGFVAGISSVALFAASGYLISKAALTPPFYTLIILTSAVKLLGLIKAGAKYGERLYSHRATFTILSNLRITFFEKLEPLVPHLFRKYTSGDLLARIVGDVESLQNFFLRVFYPPIVLLLVFISTVFFASFYSAAIAVIMLVGFLLTTIAIPALFYLRQAKLSGKVKQERGALSIEVTEFMYGFRDLKLFQQLQTKETQLLEQSETYLKQQKQENINKAYSQSVNGFITSIVSWFVLAVGAYLVANGELDGIFLAMLVMISLTVFEPAAPMAVFPIYMEESKSAATRLYDVAEDPDIQADDGKMPIELLDRAPEISLQQISFSYMGDWRATIPDLSLTIPAGSKTALIGASGSGKSTLLQLILKMQQVQVGEIHWNNQSLATIDAASIWQQTKVVLQENHLFYGTIRDNLLLADNQLDDQQMEKALAEVNLGHLALDANVSENGENLSGGEKQRLAIARALLKKGNLWILDEPTSSLDAQTEQMIYQHIFEQVDGDTLLLVSHRLYGLEKMDQIIVMDHGNIVESGSYYELMEKRGYFYQMKILERSLL